MYIVSKKKFYGVSNIKANWGNKKNAPTKEDTKHSLRKRKREKKKEKEEKERTNLYKEYFTKLKETTNPRNSDLYINRKPHYKKQ